MPIVGLAGCGGSAAGDSSSLSEEVAEVSDASPASDASASPPVDAVPDAALAEPDAASIADLSAEPGVPVPLACTVRWTTAGPTPSAVEFGAGDAPTHRVEVPGLRTDHAVEVIGLRADTLYHMRVAAPPEGGEPIRSSAVACRTPPLPPSLPIPTLTTTTTLAAPRWTLFGVGGFALDNASGQAAALVIDEEAQVVWYWQHPTFGNVGTQVEPTTGDVMAIGSRGQHIMDGWQISPRGDVVWRTPWRSPDVGLGALLAPVDASYHHLVRALPNGNVATLRFDLVQQEVAGKLVDVYHDELLELTRDGELVWAWNSKGHVAPSGGGDWLHGNALYFTGAGDAVYSASALGQVWKIDRATGEIVWRLGQGGDFAPDPRSERPWFAFQHDPSPSGPGRILLYDNGPVSLQATRLVEYALDEVAMTAEIVWEYPPAGVVDRWFSAGLGSAQRLDDGNTFACGIRGVPPGEGRLFEVTPDGELAWEATTPETLLFRGTRIPPWHVAIPPEEPITPF
jgi:hypothetical protein